MTQKQITPPRVAVSRELTGVAHYFSGVVGVDSDWQPVQTTLADEVAQVFQNVQSALDARGLGRESIVQLRAYLDDFSFFRAFNEGWEVFFEGIEPPARTTVGAALHPPFRVEVDFVAEGGQYRADG